MRLQFFKPEAFRPGDILHVTSTGFFSRAIRRCINSKGSHDAMLIFSGGGWCVGESLLGAGSTLTPLAKYEEDMAVGKTLVSILRIPETSASDQFAAQGWWINHVFGKTYDRRAIGRVFIKCIFGDWCKSAAGWEWAWYCTEGIRAAWTTPAMSRDCDIWGKNNPTPGTTEKRVAEGKLLDVTSDCLTRAGARYILNIPQKDTL